MLEVGAYLLIDTYVVLWREKHLIELEDDDGRVRGRNTGKKSSSIGAIADGVDLSIAGERAQLDVNGGPESPLTNLLGVGEGRIR